MVSPRLRNAAIAPFRPAPQGFGQAAPSRADQAGEIPPGICPVGQRTIITAWSNLNAIYLWDRTLAQRALPANGDIA